MLTSFFQCNDTKPILQDTIQYSAVRRAQNNLSKEDSGGGKPEVGWMRTGPLLLWSEEVGQREFSGRVRAATIVAATDFII
jgi:hypothetical protein